MPSPVHYHTGKFPPQSLDWARLVPLVGSANAALARYDGLLLAIPNAGLMLSPLTTHEAVLSSRIEGTQATMGEVLDYEAGERDIDPEKAHDIAEVLNYRKALREAQWALKKLPLCGRLVKQAHAVLLSGVRGHDKARGQYRTIQNYIGNPDGTVAEARFVPIEPELVAEGMDRWEKYVHSPAPDPLVQLAIVHAEFESLHPFLDGNGRVGRMLVPLFLFEKRLLHSPMFYLSEFLERNREEYCDRLLAVSRDDDWTGWCDFFLRALSEQAKLNEAKVRKILALYSEKKEWVVGQTHSLHAVAALDCLFRRPIIGSSMFIKESKIPAPTARRILSLLLSGGMLKTVRAASGRRPAVFTFPELLNIVGGRKVF